MPDREKDERRRPAGAFIPGPGGEAGRAGGVDAGHAGAKGMGDAGGAKGLGNPGDAKGLGDSGDAKGLGDPGGVKGLGNPGDAKGLGDPGAGPGGAKGLGDPRFPQPGYPQPGITQPGYPQPGSVPPGYGAPPGSAPPGYGPPPGFSPPGVTPSGVRLSINGILVSVAAIVAIIVAAIAAFLVLRPDPPRQTAEDRSIGTIDTPAESVDPTIAASSEALFRGTYNSRVTVTSAAGVYTNDNVGTVVSDCAHCDATLSGSGGSTTFHWNGGAWEHQTTGPICAGDTITFTPTVVADDFVQELDYYYATCNGTVSTGTMTRVGD